MNKKVKYLLLAIVVLICLLGVKVLAGFNSGSDKIKYNGTELSMEELYETLAKGESNTVNADFLNANKSDTLLGKKLTTPDDEWDYLSGYRRSFCLNHYKGSRAVTYLNAKDYYIYDVLDIKYDSRYGGFLLNNGKGKIVDTSLKDKIIDLSVMTYLNGKYSTDSLVNGAENPLKTLLKVAWGKLSRDERIGNFIPADFKLGGVGADDLLNLNIHTENGYWNNLPNSSDIKNELEQTVDKYEEFKEISKINVKDSNTNKVIEAQENICSVKLSDYTTVGPFCMDFNNENGVVGVYINNNQISDNNNLKIYIEGKSQNFENFNVNKIEANTPFYLAIKNSVYTDMQIRGKEEYKIKFKQQKFEYYRTRIALLGAYYDQQLGIFVEDNIPTEVEGEVEYPILRTPQGKELVIKKVGCQFNSNVTVAVPGVKLKVYGVKIDGNNNGHWIAKDAENEEAVTFVNSFSEATTWETDTLRRSKY